MFRTKCSHSILRSQDVNHWANMTSERRPWTEVIKRVYEEFVGLPHTALALKLFFIKKMPVRIKSTTPRLPFFSRFTASPLCRRGGPVNPDQSQVAVQTKISRGWPVFPVVWLYLYLFSWQIPCLAFHECCLNLSSNQSQEMRSVISSFSDMRKLKTLGSYERVTAILTGRPCLQ